MSSNNLQEISLELKILSSRLQAVCESEKVINCSSTFRDTGEHCVVAHYLEDGKTLLPACKRCGGCGEYVRPDEISGHRC
jgi:hypothetical protein